MSVAPDLVPPQALDAASRWMTRLAQGVGESDLAAFRLWLETDLDNARAMDVVSATWDATAALPSVSRFHAVQAADTLYFEKRRLGLRSVLRPAFALVLLLITLAAAALLWQADAAPALRYATGPAERLDIQLADGSQIRLDAQSEVTVQISWRRRALVLERGAAEFAVAHERLRPFTVATPRIVVRAVGTDFAVRREADETSIVLVLGIVDLDAVATGRTEARLYPNQKATFRPQLPGPVIHTVKPADELAWRSGQIVLERTRLADAVRRFARYASSEIKLAPEIANLEVSGVYKADELLPFLDGLARVQPVRWHRDEGGAYVVTRRDAN